MKGYNFTEDVRAALARAREESARLRHEYVGTEHILLGFSRQDNIAVGVIESFGVNPDASRRRGGQYRKEGRERSSNGPGPALHVAHEEGARVGDDGGTRSQPQLRRRRASAPRLIARGERHRRAASGRRRHQPRSRARARAPGPGPAPTAAPACGARRVDVRDDGLGGHTGRPDARDDQRVGAMAASIIELLARDADVGAVFAAQGIDVAKLVEALACSRHVVGVRRSPERGSATASPEPPATRHRRRDARARVRGRIS